MSRYHGQDAEEEAKACSGTPPRPYAAQMEAPSLSRKCGES